MVAAGSLLPLALGQAGIEIVRLRRSSGEREARTKS
jgi:hypothetical protein